MKRSQSPDLEVQLKSSAQDAQDAAQEASSRLAEDLKTANANTLQTPFQDTRPVLPNETLPKTLDMNETTPVPGTTITSILNQTKPTCTKAQTWIEAQKFSDQERARAAYKTMTELAAKVHTKQHVRLERVAAMRLARKAREIRIGKNPGQGRHAGGQGGDARQGHTRLSQREKVQQANIRLQRALRVAHWD